MPSKNMSPLSDKPPVSFVKLLPTAAAAILAIVIVNGTWESWHVPSTHAAVAAKAASRPLQLRATLSAQQLEVSWDHSSSVIQQADTGMLRISEGDITESVPFEASQLQDGVLVYRPRTNDVSVRMEVTERDGSQVSESVRAVAMP
jgi:hypothetical protein